MLTLRKRLAICGLMMVLLISAGAGQMRSNKFGVGASGSYFVVQTDYAKASPSFGGGVDLSYSVAEYFSIRTSLGAGFLQAKNDPLPSLSTTLIFANLYLTADLSPNGDVNPFIFAGGTGYYFDARQGDGTPLTGAGIKRTKGTLVGGAGFDFFVSEFLSFTLAGEYSLPTTDRLDGLVFGSKKDGFARVSFGFRYYFFDQEFITRMLKALEERYSK